MYLYGVLLLCASSFLVGHNGTQEGIVVSREEELDLEKQLELLNKPAVTTIHTNYGDIIDCVDFYKQPAFDHPLLKNHTFSYEMRPTSLPRRVKDQVSPKFAKPVTRGLKGGGCPIGTVPIRRITEEDLIRERLRSKIKSFEDNSLGTHYAVLRTMANSNKKFVGAGAQISTHNPHVDGRQYSAARVKIRNGPDSLETGWRYPHDEQEVALIRLFHEQNGSQSQHALFLHERQDW
ncbi:protein neprosin-like [Rhododendron vialii]|uniref:protein neprosin-like n=1 Tax=Rhododendron vialii TaxID=182163 RepID=UPI00265F4C2B|nr:protein neprosin-like [Rhododendron vialii]